jgi:hypothetical protein
VSRILCPTLLCALCVLALVAGCSSGKQVTRIEDTSTQIDLSGKWNDIDSQQMAEGLVRDSMTGTTWIENHIEARGERPTIIIAPIKNNTLEHIPQKTLVADLEKQFINSGRVKVVASAEEREVVRSERADQQEFASPETMKQWGRERGADYMLIGELNAIFDREEGDEVKYYQLDCYFVNLEDNTKVWVGDHRIKKFVGRSKYKG